MIDELAVQQVLGRYARAHDRRDGTALAALFTPDGRTELLYNRGGVSEPLGELVGRAAIADAVTHMMKPHPEGGWSHNAIDGVLVEVHGDRAVVDAQFMVFSIKGAIKPDAGWPAGVRGTQGTITPIESGYYRYDMVRAGGTWLIEKLVLTMNLPLAF